MYTKLAHAISYLLHPFLIPTYLMLIVLYFRTAFINYPMGIKFYLLWVVILFTLIIPMLVLMVLRSIGRIDNYRVATREERILPLLIGGICYMLCAWMIIKIPSAALLSKMMIAAAICELFALIVTLRWQISLHLTAMGAATALLAVLTLAGVGNLMVVLALAIGCAGLLASSRLYLGRHDGLQIFAGFGGGFVVTTLTLLFF
ncbi:MAG: hypothetical protein RR330_03585 [Alistipes sp.]